MPRPRVALPRGALTAEAGRPAVWIVDPEDGVVALRQIDIDSYDVGKSSCARGLEPGDTVVTAGTQLLAAGAAGGTGRGR